MLVLRCADDDAHGITGLSHAGAKDQGGFLNHLSRQARIDAYMTKVQALDRRTRWLYETDSMNLAVALGKQPILTRKSQRLLSILRFFHQHGLAQPLLTAATGILLVRLLIAHWLYQYRVRHHPKPHFLGIFISIGAMREPAALTACQRHVNAAINIIDERLPHQAEWGRPITPKLAFNHWWDALTWIMSAWRRGDIIGFSDELFFLNCLRLLPYKAYYASGFSIVQSESECLQHGVTVCCVTPSLSAFTAIEQGLRSVFYPHGLLRRSLVFPDFERVFALNVPEAEHIRSRLPFTNPELVEQNCTNADTHYALAIAGVYSPIREHEQLKDLIEGAYALGISVFIRPHPKDPTDYWARWHGREGICFDTDGDFAAFLGRVRPRILASWFSTTLLDALAQGVIPLNIGEIPDDLVFPLQQVALQWPEDQERVFTYLSNQDEASAYLSASQEYVFGGA